MSTTPLTRQEGKVLWRFVKRAHRRLDYRRIATMEYLLTGEVQRWSEHGVLIIRDIARDDLGHWFDDLTEIISGPVRRKDGQSSQQPVSATWEVVQA